MDVQANDLEQVLFPHYVSHPIGLGQSEISHIHRGIYRRVDLHESSHLDRNAGQALHHFT